MPKMVIIEPNPDFKPGGAAEKEAWSEVKNDRPREVAFLTAMENIRNSGGMYRITDTTPPGAEAMHLPAVPALQDMRVVDLLAMAAGAAVDVPSGTKKADIVALLQKSFEERARLVEE
jgi:hypothetical protein